MLRLVKVPGGTQGKCATRRSALKDRFFIVQLVHCKGRELQNCTELHCKGRKLWEKANLLVKFAQKLPISPKFWSKIPHFLGKLQNFRPYEIFHGNSLHCEGPILKAKIWAELMVVLRSSAPSPGDL